MSKNTDAIVALANGVLSSREIAQQLGLSRSYVQRVMRAKGCPQLPSGAQPGARNHQYKGGRVVDLDGYVLALAPEGHPRARLLPGRTRGRILEHRLVLERSLGRYLEPHEVVDHIDGLRLHNDPANLRVFASNAEHLRVTRAGLAPRLSPQGARNTGARIDRGRVIQPVDMYRQRKESGDVRLRQILLCALSLGSDSPHLSGTHHYMEQAGIDPGSRRSLERGLRALLARWGHTPDP